MQQPSVDLAKMSLDEIRELPLWRLSELNVWRLALAITSCPNALQGGIYKMLCKST